MRVKDFGYERDLICTDNPVCYEEITDDFEFLGQFCFPLSKELILIKNYTNAYDFDEIQKYMIDKAKEKVVGSSKGLLEHLCNS